MRQFVFIFRNAQDALNVTCQCNDIVYDKEPQETYPSMPQMRKILVLINPMSCNGRPIRVWANARQIFDASAYDTEVKQTEHAGHAKEIGEEDNFDEYYAIVTVSGDGLIHELVNGLLNRQDGHYENRQIPIGVLPGGSVTDLGNAYWRIQMRPIACLLSVY